MFLVSQFFAGVDEDGAAAAGLAAAEGAGEAGEAEAAGAEGEAEGFSKAEKLANFPTLPLLSTRTAIASEKEEIK